MPILNMATGLAHIGIPTKDIKKTIDFYTGLGFETILETFNKKANEKVAFLQFKDIVIETYETSSATGRIGAIDHIAINVTDIETTFKEAKDSGYDLLDEEIQYLPFWENGVRFFTLKGPSEEKIEFSQKS